MSLICQPTSEDIKHHLRERGGRWGEREGGRDRRRIEERGGGGAVQSFPAKEFVLLTQFSSKSTYIFEEEVKLTRNPRSASLESTHTGNSCWWRSHNYNGVQLATGKCFTKDVLFLRPEDRERLIRPTP